MLIINVLSIFGVSQVRLNIIAHLCLRSLFVGGVRVQLAVRGRTTAPPKKMEVAKRLRFFVQ